MELRKLPLVSVTPAVPGKPGRPEERLCPANVPAWVGTGRGQSARLRICFSPTVSVPGGSISGPQVCVDTWVANYD